MNDPRTTRNQFSLRQLHVYLLSILRKPADFLADERLKVALNSQSNLAHFELPEAGITGMSLNTAKRTASVLFEDDGYSHIDQLRLKCAEALADARVAPTAKGKIDTKTALRARVDAAEQHVLLLSEDLQIATGLLRESMIQARAYASRADSATQTRCAKEQRDLLRKMGLIRKGT